MAHVPVEYRYRMNPWKMIAAILFFGAMGAVLWNEAVTNDRGLVVNGVFTFGVEGATRFYWVLTAFSGALIIAAFVTLASSIGSTASVLLTSQELQAPRNAFTRKPTVIPVPEIVDVRVQQVQKQRMLNVYHSGGKLVILQSMLPNEAAFANLHAALLSVIPKK